VIDFWEDPQCPVCKLFDDVNGDYIESLIREKKATVRYHVLSFLGDESVRAFANASFCAADEGQYLDFHHALYAVQSPLENSGFWSNETLVNIGKKIGITSQSFADCVTKVPRSRSLRPTTIQ
jgi:protein-disulfide isomerase